MPRIPHILTALPTLTADPTPASVRERIAAVLALAGVEDWTHGLDWYGDHAAEAVYDLAGYYNADPRTIAGMLAAMSSGYTWGDSLAHISILFETPGDRTGIAAPYGWLAIEQAEAIRDGADPADLLLMKYGKKRIPSKRWNFFYGLVQGYALWSGQPCEVPAFAVRPTIDVHMARGLTGGVWDQTPSPPRYAMLAAEVEREAEARGLNPHDLQAVLWTVIRGAAH